MPRVTARIFEKGNKTPRIVKHFTSPSKAVAWASTFIARNPKLRYTVDYVGDYH